MPSKCCAMLLHPQWIQLCINLLPLHSVLLYWTIQYTKQIHIKDLQTRVQPERMRKGKREGKKNRGGEEGWGGHCSTLCTLISSQSHSHKNWRMHVMDMKNTAPLKTLPWPSGCLSRILWIIHNCDGEGGENEKVIEVQAGFLISHSAKMFPGDADGADCAGWLWLLCTRLQRLEKCPVHKLSECSYCSRCLWRFNTHPAQTVGLRLCWCSEAQLSGKDTQVTLGYNTLMITLSYNL